MFLVYLDNDMRRCHAYFDESHVGTVDAFMMALSAGLQPQGWESDDCKTGLLEMQERGEWREPY